MMKITGFIYEQSGLCIKFKFVPIGTVSQNNFWNSTIDSDLNTNNNMPIEYSYSRDIT